MITAGPTWVPIDDVRVISNISTGRTGILLAEEASQKGAKVTLFLGPTCKDYTNRAIKIVRFRFFDELRERLKKELRLFNYDLIIHTAAVSDFGPVRYKKGKIKSGQSLNLKLKPLPKIIKDIKRLASKARLVMFKLESGVSFSTLKQKARAAQIQLDADYVVANTLCPYRAFIIDRTGNTIAVRNRSELAKRLLKIIYPKIKN
ncbi:MAG: hypothetical protein NC908_03070 [Candidatus Omnitrophica bacterium]|nr:hypothetical protein [Candidatus Omnitrophota bacterium]